MYWVKQSHLCQFYVHPWHFRASALWNWDLVSLIHVLTPEINRSLSLHDEFGSAAKLSRLHPGCFQSCCWRRCSFPPAVALLSSPPTKHRLQCLGFKEPWELSWGTTSPGADISPTPPLPKHSQGIYSKSLHRLPILYSRLLEKQLTGELYSFYKYVVHPHQDSTEMFHVHFIHGEFPKHPEGAQDF